MTLARSVGEELIGIRREVDRYFLEAHKEFQRLGYPKEAAFAKHIARGTVSLAPTPEDPRMEWLGRFILRLSPTRRYILSSSVRACDNRTLYLRARGIGITTKRYSRELETILREARGYMTAFDDARVAA